MSWISQDKPSDELVKETRNYTQSMALKKLGLGYKINRNSYLFRCIIFAIALFRYNLHAPSHLFRVYNSVIFSIFTQLWASCHNQLENIFIIPPKTLYFCTLLSSPSSQFHHHPSPWQPLTYFLSLGSCPFLTLQDKWNHKACCLLCLASFTEASSTLHIKVRACLC